MKGSVTGTTKEEIVTKAAIVLIPPAPMKLMANGAPAQLKCRSIGLQIMLVSDKLMML